MPQSVFSRVGVRHDSKTAPAMLAARCLADDSDADTAVDTLGVGSMDELVAAPPVPPAEVVPTAPGRVAERQRGSLRLGAMIGDSPAMESVYRQVLRVATTDAAVLILGESGTGKELIAQAVHRLSGRNARGMVAVNCGAISASLIESELFGHERGSFTGADRVHRGHFERADGGTLFLDEICEMPKELQVKLLRVLESGTFTRVGGERSIRVNVRIIAAAKDDLEQAAAEGRFRADLLYRLRVIPILLPPLRDRGGDLDRLALHFVGELNAAAGTHKRMTAGALECLRGYGWPGNVRELKHALERAHILSDLAIDEEFLVGSIAARLEPVSARASDSRTFSCPLGIPLQDAGREFILATLALVEGSKSRAAELLQISTKTLYSRLREYRATGPRSSKIHDTPRGSVESSTVLPLSKSYR